MEAKEEEGRGEGRQRRKVLLFLPKKNAIKSYYFFFSFRFQESIRGGFSHFSYSLADEQARKE